MYKFSLTFLFFALTSVSFSQVYTTSSPYMERRNAENHQHILLSTGLNNPSGFLGAAFLSEVNKRTALGVGLGLSTWGIKSNLGLNYSPSPLKKIYLSVDLSVSFGVKEVLLKDIQYQSFKFRDVNMELSPIAAINLGLGSRYLRPSGNFFYWQLGFALPFSSGASQSRIIDPDVEESFHDIYKRRLEEALNVIAPGGLLLSLGYAFKL